MPDFYVDACDRQPDGTLEWANVTKALSTAIKLQHSAEKIIEMEGG